MTTAMQFPPQRITDRQVEIMTTALCEAIMRGEKIGPQHKQATLDLLIGTMIAHVSLLSASVLEANAGFVRSASSKAAERASNQVEVVNTAAPLYRIALDD